MTVKEKDIGNQEKLQYKVDLEVRKRRREEKRREEKEKGGYGLRVVGITSEYTGRICN